jgi:hypothetical protein
MASQALDNILATLRSEGTAGAPISATADRVEMLADNELKNFNKKADALTLAVWVKDNYTNSLSARLPEIQQWYKNLDMYQGRQFTQWSSDQRRMVEQPTANYEPRLSVNVIEPMVRTEMAKTGSKHPKAIVSAASNDDEDIMAAEAAQNLMDWFYEGQRFQTAIFNPANLFRTVCGNGFIKTYFDPDAEDEAATAAAQKMQDKQNAEDSAQAQASNITDLFPPQSGPVDPVLGKIKSEHCRPDRIFVSDLEELDIQKMDWVMDAYTISPMKAKMRYKSIMGPDWEPATVNSQTQFNISHLGIKTGAAKDKRLTAVLIREMWVKPKVHKLIPKGGLIMLAGDDIVALGMEGLPYAHKEFPFAHIHGIETGRFYRKSVVESVINIQNELNRTFAQIIKQKNLHTKPQFFYDEGSVDPSRITSKSGQYIPIRLGSQRPTAVPIVPLANYVLDLLTRLSAIMDDITGQHAISRGQTPGASTAANALAALKESDNDFLFTVYDSIEAATQTIGRQYLALAIQYWDEPRMVTVTGLDHSADAKMLSSAELIGGTDLRVEAGSGLPDSKAARIATITDWIAKGIVQPQDGLEAMELGTLGKIFDRIQLDRAAAKRENLAIRDIDPMAYQQWQAEQQAQEAQAQAQEQAANEYAQFQGIVDPGAGLTGAPPEMPPMPAQPNVASGPNAITQPGAVAAAPPGELQGAAVPKPAPPIPPSFFPINWYDNHAVHMEEHRNVANSQGYANWSPESKEVSEAHYYAHLQMKLNLDALMAERQSSIAAQEAAEMSQQAPAVRMMARIGGRNQYAGEQFAK